MIRYSAAIGALACALVLSKCSLNSTDTVAGGGDDFPNSATVASMGEQIAADLNGYADWDENLQASGDLPGVSAETGLGIPSSSQSVAKRRATALDSVVAFIDSSDTATLGVIRFIAETHKDGFIRYDTLTYRWDNAYTDIFPGNEHIVSAHSRTVYTTLNSSTSQYYDDADGDGIINNEAASSWRASATFINETAGYRERAYLIIDAGADLDFDSDSDNVILTSTYAKTKDSDTLETYTLDDADGDGVVLDMSADSCVVDLTYRSKPSLLSLSAASSRMNARYIVFPGDSTKDYIIKYMGQEVSSTDTVLASILGLRADSTFLPGDTAFAEMVTRSATGSCTAIDSILMTVKLGPIAQDSADDSLVSVYARTLKCSGDERDVVLAFSCTPPIAEGQEPIAGTLTYGVTYDTNEWARVEGNFDAQYISATFTSSDSTRLEVVWDRQGTLVSYTNAP